MPCHVLGGLEITECSFAASTVDGSFHRSTIGGGRGIGMCILHVDRRRAKFPLVRVHARICVIYIIYMSFADLHHWRVSSDIRRNMISTMRWSIIYTIIPLN